MVAADTHADDVREELLTAMRERGYKKRTLARELQERHPRGGGDDRKGIESWRNTIGRYVTSKADRRQVPDEDTARLLADILDWDLALLFKPRGGGPLLQENAQLRQENQRLLDLLREAGVEYERG